MIWRSAKSSCCNFQPPNFKHLVVRSERTSGVRARPTPFAMEYLHYYIRKTTGRSLVLVGGSAGDSGRALVSLSKKLSHFVISSSAGACAYTILLFIRTCAGKRMFYEHSHRAAGGHERARPCQFPGSLFPTGKGEHQNVQRTSLCVV